MPTIPKRTNFFETEAGQEIEDGLHSMVADAAFNTEDSYTANIVLHPDNLMPFVEKHKLYLITHPAIDPGSYVANLRLKTRLRR